MIRRLLDIGPWLIAGLMLGLGVHLASILILPRLAPGDARSRIEAVAPVNRATLVRDADQIGLPLTDPAFEIVLCPFDLAEGVMRVRAPVTQHYTTISLYNANGLPFAAINDRAATRRAIDMFIATAAQRRDMPVGDDDARSDMLVVQSQSRRGLAVIRALSVQPGTKGIIQDLLAEFARCDIVAPDQVGVN